MDSAAEPISETNNVHLICKRLTVKDGRDIIACESKDKVLTGRRKHLHDNKGKDLQF